MKRLNKILVPIDLSDTSVPTVQQAIDIARGNHAQIIILHVYSRPLFAVSGKDRIDKKIIHKLERGMLYRKERRAKLKLDSLMKKVTNVNDVKFTIIKTRGLLHDRIKEVIKGYGVDLVVMGTNNYSLRQKIWNHRVARLSEKINVPLLVVPSVSEMSKPARIAFAYDLKNIQNLEELNLVKLFSEMYNAEIHLFTVMHNKTLGTEELSNLDRLKEYFQGYSPIIHTIDNRNVERGILQYLHKYQISMVAIIHRSRNLFRGMFHKSISKKLVLSSDVPVLTLEEH